MAATPSKLNLRSKSNPKPSPAVTPQTPQSLPPPRRSTRQRSLSFNSVNPAKHPRSIDDIDDSTEDKVVTRRTVNRRNASVAEGGSGKKGESLKQRNGKGSVKVPFAPQSPYQSETKKRKTRSESTRTVVTTAISAKKGKLGSGRKGTRLSPKSRVYYKKVVYDGGEFEVGDDVYVKRREDACSDDEEPENVEECRVCFDSGSEVMIECDDCLGGFHLKCLKPPLKEVPEGDWVCGFCETRKMGRDVSFPKPPEGKKLVARTPRQKLLSSDLWAARIESIWNEVDGNY